MNEETIKTVRVLSKYYTIDYLLNLVEDVSSIFNSCDISFYLKDHAKNLAVEKGISYCKRINIGKFIKLTSKNKNSVQFKDIAEDVEVEVIDGLSDIYSKLFKQITKNRDTIREQIDLYDRDKLCEFRIVADWLVSIYSNAKLKCFRTSISANNLKKFYELKYYFIKDYCDECWLAFEVICLYNYLTHYKQYYKEYNESEKKRYGIIGLITRVTKPKKFISKLYSKTF